MKLEIILAVALMSLSIGERQQRSTVLTDESKRVLEHFDFSNFDRQEALNYIDRQRYENQIRGKRSHYARMNSKKPLKNTNTEDENENNEIFRKFFNTAQPGPRYKLKLFEVKNLVSYPKQEYTRIISNNHPLENSYINNTNSDFYRQRRKRGHYFKKSRYVQSNKLDDTNYNDDDDYSVIEERRRKKRKKRKKKRRHWNNWTEWGPCSVTCGRGRKIRWRKCIAKSCETGEYEMGEKTCQLPACNLLTKILGF